MRNQQRTRRSEADWQEIINAHSASGLSAKKYCDKQNIGYASFCNWRSKLSRQGVLSAYPAQFPCQHIAVFSDTFLLKSD